METVYHRELTYFCLSKLWISSSFFFSLSNTQSFPSSLISHMFFTPCKWQFWFIPQVLLNIHPCIRVLADQKSTNDFQHEAWPQRPHLPTFLFLSSLSLTHTQTLSRLDAIWLFLGRQFQGHIFILFYGRTCIMWKFSGQRLNPSRSCDLCCNCVNAASFNPCSRQEIKPIPPQLLELLQLNS